MARNLVVVVLVVLVLAVVLLVLLVVLILVVLALAVLAVLRVVAIVVLIVVVHDSSFPLPLWTLIVWQHLIPGALHIFAKLQPPVGYQLHEVVCQKLTKTMPKK